MSAVTAVGTGTFFSGLYLSAMGKYQEGKQAKQAHDWNAKMTEREAAFREEQTRGKWKRLMGQQLALYGKAGVDLASGSPLLVLGQTAAQAEIEALNIRYLGEAEAEMERWYGKKAKKAGRVAAWSTLLTGAGTALAISGYGGGGGDGMPSTYEGGGESSATGYGVG